ncbi:MAG: PAS domain S-box protein [Thermodesulfobacteriota bacterium]
MQVKQIEAELQVKQLRSQLEERNDQAELFRIISENMLDMIALADMEGNFTFAGKTHEILGYEPGFLIGKNVMDFVHPEDFPRVLEQSGDFFATGHPRKVEYRYKRADGTYLWLETVGNFLRDKGATPQQIVFSSRDITDRKNAEQQLKESEEKYRRIAENITDVVWTTDLNLNPTFVSASVQKLLGETPEKHMRRTMAEKIPPFYLNKMYQVLAEELEKENDPASDKDRSRLIELKHYKADGSTIWVSINISAIRDEYGNFVGLQGVTRDISEQKKREEEQEKLQNQLYQAQKMESVGRLAGGVAHDFNNKLFIINGYAEMAIDMIEPDGALYENIREIHAAGQQSAGIVRQLLAFARQQTISPVLLDLNDTISGMIKMLHRLLGENIDLAWHPGNNLWPVKIDPSQVDQIMANLAVNARDAISDVGNLTIETKNKIIDEDYCNGNPEAITGKYVMLAVSDDGCGMEKEVQNLLFEPFFTTKEIGKGTGLGLPTIYGIVKQNEGFINVYSEPGEGTTFSIYLPSQQAGKLSSGAAEKSAVEIPKGSETILLVEDEPAILEMGKKIIRRLGYKVLSAERPEAAVQLAAEYKGKIDLLITDVVMPEMNGRDLALRVARSQPGLKILYMSGYTADVIAHHGVLDKGVQFIQKPLSVKDLAVKVREAIEQG